MILPVGKNPDVSLAYIYIFFSTIIMEADMRLSYSESVCQSYEKQIKISGNGGTVSQDTKNNGCAVGDPRLVPLAL